MIDKKKRLYVKPTSLEVKIQMADLCVGSHCGGIDVQVIHEIKRTKKTYYKFDKDQTINDNMWNPRF